MSVELIPRTEIGPICSNAGLTLDILHSDQPILIPEYEKTVGLVHELEKFRRNEHIQPAEFKAWLKRIWPDQTADSQQSYVHCLRVYLKCEQMIRNKKMKQLKKFQEELFIIPSSGHEHRQSTSKIACKIPSDDKSTLSNHNDAATRDGLQLVRVPEHCEVYS